ncbi:MAG: glycosyltransferase [Pseudomonadota bacterium]
MAIEQASSGLAAAQSADGCLRISIVTPNFNGAAFIEETLKSVVSQNYSNLEYIVVDGASTDGSLSIIEEYRSRISTLIVEPDEGHADALNKGFAAATGDILGWINSDDILLPNALSFVDRLFRRHPDIDWITGRPSSMGEDGKIRWIGPLRPWSRLRFLSGDNKWIQQESTFWRRSLWRRAGGALDLRYALANDFDLWRRFFRSAELHSVDRYLGCFRVRTGQRSIAFKSQYEKEMASIIDEELASLDSQFSDAFSALLPASSARSRPLTVIAADPRYAVCDTPIVRSGEVFGWSRGEERGHMPRGEVVSITAAASDLSCFKNLHEDERCFIMGNGPSLNATDLSLLATETVFACNAAFMLFDRISWRPKYYACVDSRVLPDRAREIDAMLNNDPGMIGFFPAVLLEHSSKRRRTITRTLLPPAHNRFFFNERPNSADNLPHSMFSYDINDYVVQPFTVAITLLQLAAYMGFSEIILIGCDTTYVVPQSAKREGDGADLGVALTSAYDDDQNHFDRRYFGKGRKWHDPQPDKMIMHYEHAKKALDAIGVRVYNATVGGKLEVFPRRPLEDFFKDDGSAPVTRSPSSNLSALAEAPAATAQRNSGAGTVGEWAALVGGLLQRSRGLALAGAVAIPAVAIVAYLMRSSPALPYFLGGAGFFILLGLLAAVALRTRGFVAELSRQLLDISMGASNAVDDVVIGRLEMEDELARLREELEEIKELLAPPEGRTERQEAVERS